MGVIVIVVSLAAAVALPALDFVFLFISTLGAWIAFCGGMIAAPKGQGRWFDMDEDV